MSRPLFWSGVAMTGIVVAAMAADFAARVSPRDAPVLPTPEGFKMRLRDIGPVEVAFTGRIELITDRREEEEGGAATRVPRWKVTGDDPAPDGAGMGLDETRIEAAAREGEAAPPMVATAPRAWIALERQRGLLTIDLDRPWRLNDPVLELPGFRDGARMTATSRGMATLRPREQTIEARGPFRLEAENLRLDAAAFSYDAANRRVRFEPWQGAVRWSFDDGAGGILRGESDAGGEIVPTPEGGMRLLLREGARGVRAALPAGLGLLPAMVVARGLTLDFDAGSDKVWRPVRARAEGPLLLSDARVAIEGGAAELSWEAGGALREARIAGPIAAMPWAPPVQAAAARESAVYDAETGALTLDGRAWAVLEQGAVAAEALEWNGETLAADGRVIAHGPVGTALAAFAAASEASGLLAGGGVRLLPALGDFHELAGPSLGVDPRGEAWLEKGFVARGLRGGIPWTVSGDGLRQRVPEPGQRRVEADGHLIWTEPGLRLEGDRFRQLDERRFRLEGGPARAWMELEGGDSATASFRRLEADESTLQVEGEPNLLVPAAALGLSGENVRLRARTFRRAAEDGAWTLDGSVEATGALVATADRAFWSPTAGLRLERAPAAPTAEGTLADGTHFRVTAREFAITAERILRLAGAVQGQFTLPDGSTHAFEGERLEAGEFGGIAEGSVIVHSSLGQGQGDRAEWRVREGRLVWLLAEGSARLERADLVAIGERIEMDEDSGWMDLQGTSAAPAQLRRSDGREARGLAFGYNTRSLLLRGSGVRFEAPAPPR